MTTKYKRDCDAFKASPEFERWLDFGTLGTNPEVRRVMLANRLMQAFEDGWMARDTDNGT